jgi:hypothetical protein
MAAPMRTSTISMLLPSDARLPMEKQPSCRSPDLRGDRRRSTVSRTITSGGTEAQRSDVESLLAERGYRLAASTIDTSDYLFDKAYTRAARDPVMRRRIEQAFLDHSRTQIRYYQALSRQVLGREPPAIILLHNNRINAATLDRLIAIFRSEGFRFVSLAQAQADEAYRKPPKSATRFGPMWGYRWARERHVRVDGSLEEEPPKWLLDYAERGAVSEP